MTYLRYAHSYTIDLAVLVGFILIFALLLLFEMLLEV